MANKNKLKVSDFVHLHNHTDYSVLDGLSKVGPLVDLVDSFGMEAVAITDHGNLSGVIDFYKVAKSKKINPIIGMEAYIAARKHTDRDPVKDKNRFHVILLATNNTGYKNLMRLSTIANLDGFYYFPRIDHDLMEKYNEGLICLSGCMSGEVGDALKQNQYKLAKELATWYKQTFSGRYYIEIQDHGHPDNPKFSEDQKRINDQLFKLAKELDLPVVVTSDAHYLLPEDQEAHEVLLCVGTGNYLSEEKRMTLEDFPLFVENPNEIIKRWGSDHPEIITNTKEIANRCNVEIEFGKILIPQFPVPKGETEKSYLTKLIFNGLGRRYLDQPKSDPLKTNVDDIRKKLSKEVLDRVDFELATIGQMGFDSYFLIISDFVNWGKEKGIVFGPGRGSAAGSITSYALRITEIDPITYDLLFERFLNPDRISMPDIDIDIQDNRREEVIDYCIEKYGKDKVANIVTFGRMFARNAVRDVSRVLEVPYAEADRIAKMLPMPVQGRHIPLEQTLKDDEELKDEYRSNPTTKRVIDLAEKLEGTIRSHGVHAAGIVIAPEDIVNFVPLEMAQKGVVATQYSLGPIEELGLLKMDLLGLSNLTIIKNALRIIKRVNKVDIDISQISLQDKKTFDLFKNGDTTGVFQLESAGMKRYLKLLQPNVFEDIIAMNALYRPGPMQWIDDFIERKQGKRTIEYVDNSMEPALKTTYGVIVYQEQVMQISKDMCGFTGGQADTLRKAIGKKKPDELAKLKSDFINGAINTVNANRGKMEKFWTQLEAFAAYCFPKSHAACYALIAYQTAYLKAHYPDAYMAALMTSDYDNTDRLAIEIVECKRIGIEVLLPDVNESFEEFAVVPDKNQIRFGLNAIKNVGSSASQEILRAREEGRFESLEDFFSRVNTRTVNRKSLESLIKSGAFDRFGERNYILQNIDAYLAYSSKLQKERDAGQTDLFSGVDGPVSAPKIEILLSKPADEATQQEKLMWERELLGIYLSEHPLDNFKEYLTATVETVADVVSKSHRSVVSVGGNITDIRQITTKNGQKMAFIKLEDQTGEVEVIIFPGLFQSKAEIIGRDKILVAKGRLAKRDKEGNLSSDPKIIAEDIEEIELGTVRDYKPPKAALIKKSNPDIKLEAATPKLFIKLENSEDQKLLMSLKNVIDQNSGPTDVVLVLGGSDNRQIIKLPVRAEANQELISQLNNLVGEENIKIS